MKKVLVFLAEGFEESEAICPVDILKRAGAEVTLVGISGKEITSSHGIKVVADYTFDNLPSNDWDCVFCPGGMPGAVNLSQKWEVNEILVTTFNRGGIVSAICASPAVVLYPLGLLKGKAATCYPGCEGYAPDFVFSKAGVVVDGNLVTAKSAGFAFDLGITLAELLFDKASAEKAKTSIYYK